jgi:TusA-related sulfurtransferase
MKHAQLSDMHANLVIDARWIPCPGPLLEAKRGIGAVDQDEVIEIQAHDPEACRDIATWAHKAGHQFLGAIQFEGYARIFVMKKRK